jgi:hypothetical protein
MGVYTHWNIQCKIKPEHQALLQHFISHHEWPAQVPQFIARWQDFLRSVNQEDDYIGLTGGNGHWGFRLELTDDGILHTCGCDKNKNNELQVFLCKVLVQLGEVLQCKITSDYVLDYVVSALPTFQFSDSDSEDDHEHVRHYTDADLRKASWRTLSLLF